MNDPTKVNSDLALLAPEFGAAVTTALGACNSAGLEAMVYEGFRSLERQAWLYAQGRTRDGPIVTYASSNLTSWHGYGLAVDIVHRERFWEPFGKDAARNEAWFKQVSEIFKKHGCNWGGDWSKPDTPHMQWGRCTASPTEGVRELMTTKGVRAVWDALAASQGAAAASPESASAAQGAGAGFRSLVPGGFYSDDPFDLKVKRSIRTNNPGALNKSIWQLSYPGFAGVTQPDSAGNKTTIYRTPEHGVGAWLHLIAERYGFGYDGTLTLKGLAMRYAGSTDPDAPPVATYVAGWAAASGGQLDADTPIALGDDARILLLARAMYRHEAGAASPLHDDQIIFGIRGERAGTLPLQ